MFIHFYMNEKCEIIIALELWDRQTDGSLDNVCGEKKLFMKVIYTVIYTRRISVAKKNLAFIVKIIFLYIFSNIFNGHYL